VEAGIAVEADRLSAEVNLATRRQAVTVAENAVRLARARLALTIGAGAAAEFALADVVPEAAANAGELEPLEAAALARHPDLLRMRAQEQAAGSGVKSARSAFGPRVNVFGHFENDSRTFTGGDGANYVGGVELQLDLFQGGAKAAQLARARALRERAAAARQMAEDAVRLEVRRAWFEHQAARQMLEVMRGAMGQAEESLRITQNRYDSGLNTITDLLRVEEAARQTQSEYWSAAYRVRISAAALELATGSLSQDSPAVSQ
jgi:outer membrane protein